MNEQIKKAVCSDIKNVTNVRELITVLEKHCDVDAPLHNLKKLQLIAYGWMFINGLPMKEK